MSTYVLDIETGWDANTSAGGASGYSQRMKIPNGSLNEDAEKVSVGFRSATGSAFEIELAYIGHYVAGGNLWKMDGNQAKLTFGGSDSVEIAADSVIWSDPVAFSLDNTKDLIISIDIGDSGAKNGLRYVATKTGFNRYYKAATDAAEVDDPAGFSATTDRLFFVEGIEKILTKISFIDPYDILNHPMISFLDAYDINNLHRISFLDPWDIHNLHRISFLDPWDIRNRIRISFLDKYRVLLRRGYNIYQDGVFQSFVAHDATLEWLSAALPYPATYEFRVHAQHDLFEERDPSNIIKTVLKADGTEDDPRPNIVSNARATNLASGNMLLEWGYDRANQNIEPTQFKIWYSTSSPVSTAGAADFTVVYNSSTWETEYSQKTGALGQDTYYFIIRAATADIDDASTAELENTNDATAPDCGQNVRASAE